MSLRVTPDGQILGVDPDKSSAMTAALLAHMVEDLRTQVAELGAIPDELPDEARAELASCLDVIRVSLARSRRRLVHLQRVQKGPLRTLTPRSRPRRREHAATASRRGPPADRPQLADQAEAGAA